MPGVDRPIPFDAYTGDEPYVFVSYAHKDSHIVYPELLALHEASYRIWYDEGIDPGNEWPEEIARALAGASHFLVFISAGAIQSRNVRNEINFALNRNKRFLAVHLEDIELPPGLELRMGDIQAVMKWRMSDEQYMRKMIRALPDDLRGPGGDEVQAVRPTPRGKTAAREEQQPPRERIDETLPAEQRAPASIAAQAARPTSRVKTEARDKRIPLRGLKEGDASSIPLDGLAPGSREAQQRQRVVAATLRAPLEVKCQHTGMHLRLIPAGEFMMGSPQRRVTLTRPYYMGIHPVTQAQYERVAGDNPSHFKGEDHLPVERISWDEAATFCRRLSEQAGKRFRLPTEAEWECACRGGTTTAYCFGDDEARMDEYAWFGGNSGSRTHPVGRKKPNAWGLYDMHGNVWEWCADWYQDGYSGLPDTDPTGPETGKYRVLRGGSWHDHARFCRSAYRSWLAPVHRFNSNGFRIVLDFP